MRYISVCIIKNNKNEILLQKKTLEYSVFSGRWVLFGGQIEQNESPKGAIARKLVE